jgi:hypothetical protein
MQQQGPNAKPLPGRQAEVPVKAALQAALSPA